MPLYEGIGLSEKQAVVIDIGAAYTKFGFAGESGPRCIVRSEIKCPDTNKVKKVLSYSNEEELYDLLVEFIHNLYFRHLLVSPKDRRVVVVESLLCPTVFRETLAKVFFRHFEAMLLNDNPEKVDFVNSTVEDIKVRTCFVTSLERSTQLETVKPPPDVLYREGGTETFNISGKIRESVYEVLFEQDNDQMSCPIDMRKPLAENILVIGGTTMAPGFKARLLQELKYLLEQPKYSSKLAIKTFKFHKPPAKENYVAWLGGAIFGGTDMITTRSLTKELYLKRNSVPDWANLSYNCREEDRISL
ncbi:hypothetical protein C0J52_12264 [Blattella germanica]|nr:hypothetical protein C0J52_12264 [Blattella germanica]